MHKLIGFALVVLIGIAMIATVPGAHAGGLWDMYKNSDLPTIQSKAYQLEVKGVNTRVYIFNAPEMKSVCTQTFGDEVVSTMQCKTYAEMGLTPAEIKRYTGK